MSWNLKNKQKFREDSYEENIEEEDEKEEVQRSFNDDEAKNEEPTNEFNSNHVKPKRAVDKSFLAFVQKHPIITTLIAMAILIVIILIIVLPLTLIKRKEERLINPKCPDGKVQPRIDCLPDTNRLVASGVNLESTCRSRSCCWIGASENDSPKCTFPYNFGFRKTKVKEDSYSNKWLELVRMNSPSSFTKSDIANLETKIEMQTDSRMRLRVCFINV